MLPRRFIPMRALPRTDRGKIDRLKLKALLSTAASAGGESLK
jgi:acyl-coenzyme A synthetase/AMP-(fatty) acid ligase